MNHLSDRDARIVQMGRHHRTQTAIAAEVGCSQATVCKVLRRNGIGRPPVGSWCERALAAEAKNRDLTEAMGELMEACR